MYNVDRRVTPLVEFVYSDLEYQPTDLRNSAIRGRVIGGCTPDRRLQVRLTDEQANRFELPISAECTFAFEGLGAGQYTVELVGFADIASRSDIALDGKNTVAIELLVPVEDTFSASALRRRSSNPTGISIIAGSAPESAGGVAKLTDSVGNEMRQVVNPDNTFRFEGLVGGVYLLTIEGGYEQGGIVVDGESGMEIIFQTLTSTWEAKVSPAGSMPGFSVVRVEVDGMRGLPVYIWKEDWEGMMRRTGSKPEYGECAAEFSPLGPGHYMVEPEGIGVWVDVELTGLEVVWIDFRRKSEPTSPTIVQPLARQTMVPTAPPDLRQHPHLHSQVFNPLNPTSPIPAYDPAYDDDEPTFGYEGDDDEEPFAADSLDVDAPDEESSWRSSLATSTTMDFQLPSLTRGEGDEETDANEQDDSDDAFDEESEDDGSEDHRLSDNADVDALSDRYDPGAANENVEIAGDAIPVGEIGESTDERVASAPLTLLIPTPVTDLDDLAALVRFVANTQSTMVRSVDDVPDGSRVLLIGTTGTEDWIEIEQQLASRGLIFERVTRRLSEALADDPRSGL